MATLNCTYNGSYPVVYVDSSLISSLKDLSFSVLTPPLLGTQTTAIVVTLRGGDATTRAAEKALVESVGGNISVIDLGN